MPDTRSALLARPGVRRLIDDWAPPALRRGVRAVRARRAGTVPSRESVPSTVRAPDAAPAKPSKPSKPSEPSESPTRPRPTPVPLAARWAELTERTLTGLDSCAPQFRPTNFWQPGVRRLLADMDELGLENFKSWPTAYFWFYPTYAPNLTRREANQLAELLRRNGVGAKQPPMRRMLLGYPSATRDFDALRLAWDQSRWPMDLDGFGESPVGNPRTRYQLNDAAGVAFGRPYLNYLLCLAALSRHVDSPPSGFVELGGGFGALGEILLARDPQARYVNLDIPPLLTVSSYYLTTLFGDDRVQTYGNDVAADGPIEAAGSSCLPNWRLPDLVGDFDVFVNSYSFQEMEPPVVENYADIVAALGVRYVVSLNSARGKVVASESNQVGVQTQTTSSMIIEMFEARGYELCATYDRPLISASGQLAVLRRR